MFDSNSVMWVPEYIYTDGNLLNCSTVMFGKSWDSLRRVRTPYEKDWDSLGQVRTHEKDWESLGQVRTPYEKDWDKDWPPCHKEWAKFII